MCVCMCVLNTDIWEGIIVFLEKLFSNDVAGFLTKFYKPFRPIFNLQRIYL